MVIDVKGQTSNSPPNIPPGIIDRLLGDSNVTLVKCLHPKNDNISVLVTLLGITILLNAEQIENED